MKKLKTKKVLLSMERDIKKIHFEMKHKTLLEIKNNLLKNIRINICKGRLFAPYVLTLGITTTIFSQLGATPFIIDKEKNYQRNMEEIDESGTIRIEQQYNDFESTKNTVTYYSKWYKSENGQYIRDIRKYQTDDLLKEEIINLIKLGKVKDYNDIFGEPKEVKREIKNDIREEELNQDAHLFAQIYFTDFNDYIYVDQKEEKNAFDTVLWLIILLYSEVIAWIYRKISSFDYDLEISRINKEYSLDYIKILLEKLKIIENNYKLLTQNNKENIIFNNPETRKKINDYLYSNYNIQLSNLNGEELQDLIIFIEKIKLKYRTELELPKEDSFGIEIEMESAKRKKIIQTFEEHYQKTSQKQQHTIAIFKDKDNEEWALKYDGSLDDGIEINTPPMIDKNYNWQKLKSVLEILEKNSKVGKNCSIHIHVGTQILGNNPEYWLNFVKIWATYENVIYRFLYGEHLTCRPKILKFASPISPELCKVYEQLKTKKDLELKDIIEHLSKNKYHVVNFSHINLGNCTQFTLGNTIEFRGQNGTSKIEIIQNYTNFIIKLLEYCKSKNFDESTINQRYLSIRGKYPNIDWYNEIYLEQALELCDLIFDNNLDKLFFLKQYLKSFKKEQVNYRKIYEITDKIRTKK